MNSIPIYRYIYVLGQMKVTNEMLPVAYLEDRIRFGHHNYHVVLSLQNISERELYIGLTQNPWLSESI